MIDILEIVKRVREDISFEAHPADKLDLAQKLIYLKGLVLMMNADNEIHDNEKNYIASLIKAFDVQENALDTLIEFAENPTQEEFVELINFLRDNPINIYFLFDCITISYKDGTFHDREKALLGYLFDFLSLRENIQTFLFSLHQAMRDKNESDAYKILSNYDGDKGYFKEMFKIHSINIDNLKKEQS